MHRCDLLCACRLGAQRSHEFLLESALAARETLADRRRFGSMQNEGEFMEAPMRRRVAAGIKADPRRGGFDPNARYKMRVRAAPCARTSTARESSPGLLRVAFPNQQANASQTYLGLADEQVTGFYTLVVAEVSFEDSPERLRKGLARHPIPLMLLARMAVCTAFQGRGVGGGLLKDAMLRTLAAATADSCSWVHARTQGRSGYRHFDS